MKATKRKRLVAKGWTIGTAREFVGLSAPEAVSVELKLTLAEGFAGRRPKGTLATPARDPARRRTT